MRLKERKMIESLREISQILLLVMQNLDSFLKLDEYCSKLKVVSYFLVFKAVPLNASRMIAAFQRTVKR